MFGISSKPVDTQTWNMNSLYCVLLTAGDKSPSKQTDMSLWNFLRPILEFICFAKLVFSSSDVLSFCLSFSIRASVNCQETCREGWRSGKRWHIPMQSVKSSHLSVGSSWALFIYSLFISGQERWQSRVPGLLVQFWLCYYGFLSLLFPSL